MCLPVTLGTSTTSKQAETSATSGKKEHVMVSRQSSEPPSAQWATLPSAKTNGLAISITGTGRHLRPARSGIEAHGTEPDPAVAGVGHKHARVAGVTSNGSHNKHSPAAVKLGRILTGASWAAFVILFGFSIYYGYRGYQEAGLSLPLAFFTLVTWGVSFVMLLGNNLSGRGGSDLSIFRWPKVLLAVVQIAASVFLAAYAHWLERGGMLAYTWVPSKCYHLLHGLIATDWFATPVAIPVWIAWISIVCAAATLTGKALEAIFGSDSYIARWFHETFGGITCEEGSG
jgi:hypothetical protein